MYYSNKLKQSGFLTYRILLLNPSSFCHRGGGTCLTGLTQLLSRNIAETTSVIGRKVKEDVKQTMKIVFNDYLPQWNYTAQPQVPSIMVLI